MCVGWLWSCMRVWSCVTFCTAMPKRAIHSCSELFMLTADCRQVTRQHRMRCRMPCINNIHMCGVAELCVCVLPLLVASCLQGPQVCCPVLLASQAAYLDWLLGRQPHAPASLLGCGGLQALYR
jgi:hypothetical protein